MIIITDKAKCCGCTACMNICPVQCIVMRRDREGFDYPVANPDICISCGRCEDVCPMKAEKASSSPKEAFAVRSQEFIRNSSSGGVFPVLAGKVIGDGGVVYGAVFDTGLKVVHDEADDMCGVDRMRGSKYVQSELYAAFDDVRTYLEQGRKVMFSGTPCQIAGLKSYLGKDYDGLMTVDCACHGVPSPGLWEKYVKALEERYGVALTDVRFRSKDRSWRRYDFVVRGEDREFATPHQKDPYMLLFLQDMTLRPSCYECRFRKGGSGSDLTLADLWNVAEAAPELDDDKGVSLVMANTGKGASAVRSAGLELRKVDPDVAVRRNGGFAESLAMPQTRSEFFKGHHSAKDLIGYMDQYVIRENLLKRMLGKVRSMLSKIRRIAR